MKIKEIKLYGFKSFSDETRIILDIGITAFVGPNGSGKSNIFDALRWVFGEQSMKALRCEKTEDLIYESTDGKSDASFTEVAIIIENEDYFPQFGGEFEIKRRFYRTGESEFFLNRVKCRLQDIQALFLNSGTLTYSFLELAEIEKIIHGETKEMFDDVSGILKYQERREQTKRRLEATEQDLQRLEDIIAEMQRGLRSLKRQVRQARLYHELKEEYKTLSLHIIKHEYNTTLQELARVQQQINNLEAKRQSILQGITKLEKEREVIKNEMAQFEKIRKETLGQIAVINDSIDNIQRKIEKKDEEAKQIILSHERTITSIAEKDEMLTSNRKRLVDFEDTKQDILNKVAQVNFKIGEEKKQQDLRNEKYFTLKNEIKEKEEGIAEILDKSQLKRNEISRLQFERANKESILSRISEEHESQKKEIDNKRREKKELDKELELVLNQQNEAVIHLEESHKQLENLEKKFAELETDLQKRQQAITDCKIVIDTLKHRLLEKNGNKEVEKRFDKKIKGLFRTNLTVISGYEAIIDICLGDLLDFYLVSEFKDQDFDKLPEGRFGFINTSLISEMTKAPEFPKGVSCITEFVKFKAEKDILKKYIDRYFLVDDFNKANELSQKFHEYGFVTPDGILFRNGMITIEKGEFGYFKIKEGLKHYKSNLETLQNEALFVQEEKNRLEIEIEELEKSIEDQKNTIFTINVKKSEQSLKLNEIENSLEKLVKENENLSGDRDNFQKGINSFNIQINAIKAEVEEKEKEIEKLEDEKKKISDEITQTTKDIDASNSTLNEMTLELVVLQERKNSLEKTIEQLKDENQTVEVEIARLKETTEAKNLEELNEQINVLKKELDTKKKEKTECESKLPEGLIEEFNVRQNAVYDQLSEKQKAHEETQNEIMQLKYQSFQLTHKKDDSIKKVHEEFHVDLTSYVSEEIIDAEHKLTEAKGKLEKLGEINPLSLELYESEKKRLDEFLSQRDDIITAKRNLLKSIEELDQRARERFIEIFQLVKKEFNFVFSNFFEGSGADVILADPDNPLTSRIEIVVRLGGKKLKTISQLSGGQRTLLAVSLLLAFYLVKPAPFCILDEIDAPLDDANVVKFNQFLRNLSQRTQVIIITHNRATMEYTDYIYGVTMEKPRQSKIISARLADLEKIGVESET